MSRFHAAGKRQREARKAQKKREKQDRLVRNRNDSTRDESDIADPIELPDIPLSDISASGVALRGEGSGRRFEAKLFVGGLAPGVENSDLAELFKPHGEVTEATVIIDRMSGISRGFGFVVFADARHAADAVEEINGLEFMGRHLKVRPASS